jgi:hypothetical protein
MKPYFLLFLTVSVLCVATSSGVLGQPKSTGKITCKVQENGEAASGTISLRKDGTEVAHGVCGQPLSAPAGSYDAVLSLDGALDGPELTRPITVTKDGLTEVAVDFSTGILQVFIESEGKQAAGMAVIRHNGRQVGTLGSGVAAHLSAGTYEVIARYRTEKKAFESVAIERGKRVVLNASFR